MKNAKQLLHKLDYLPRWAWYAMSQAVSEIDKAFRKQVEALDEYRFIDLESEMDVMRDMLKSDGLIDEDEPKEDDPFAEVFKNRNDHQSMSAH